MPHPLLPKVGEARAVTVDDVRLTPQMLRWNQPGLYMQTAPPALHTPFVPVWVPASN